MLLITVEHSLCAISSLADSVANDSRRSKIIPSVPFAHFLTCMADQGLTRYISCAGFYGYTARSCAEAPVIRLGHERRMDPDMDSFEYEYVGLHYLLVH